MLSAHETIRAEQARVDDLLTLIDQCGDVAERANAVRFDQLVHQVLGIGHARTLTSSESWGAVSSALSRAEEQKMDPAVLSRTSWGGRELETVDDIGAVMSFRMQGHIERALAADVDQT
ncbi:hypothetical protein [Marisediminicola antarctica]|uniref:Uncharacterized protein n=1 Tax=Marisediminicola antarctica TaxID=674079 RepID=A0A7L5AFC6_9MICO|nr:hypothetical protein [Marisediminicola antarctica]QHO69160.1 hypothetical protein BHD05_05345 [Marisediminicola antarctica]